MDAHSVSIPLYSGLSSNTEAFQLLPSTIVSIPLYSGLSSNYDTRKQELMELSHSPCIRVFLLTPGRTVFNPFTVSIPLYSGLSSNTQRVLDALYAVVSIPLYSGLSSNGLALQPDA